MAWRATGGIVASVKYAAEPNLRLSVLKLFTDHLKLLATPIYSAPGCDGPNYRSLIVIAADHPARILDDLRGGICAINDWDSQSGLNVLRHIIAPLGQKGRFFLAKSRWPASTSFPSP